MDAVEQERQRRKLAERQKALEKYGEEALQPGGRPEFDILDFLINEVVGLERYAEMLLNRFPEDLELRIRSHELTHVSLTVGNALIKRHLALSQEQNLGITDTGR